MRIYLNNIRVEPSRSATGLLQIMGDSRFVICPTPHMTGFHERALGAFTAGAMVVSTPNEIIETNFVTGAEFLFARNETELANTLETTFVHLNKCNRLQKRAGNVHFRCSVRSDLRRSFCLC